MSTSEFLSLLQTSALWFSRSDLLGDPFEGSIPLPAYDYEPTQVPLESREQFRKSLSEARRQFLSYAHVNCWHMNAYESTAMWGLYSEGQDSVAVTTNFSKLASALPSWIYLGVVEYIDYAKERFDTGNMFNAFVHKRRSFSHEAELRAIFLNFPQEVGTLKQGSTQEEITRHNEYVAKLEEMKQTVCPSGASISIDLNATLEGIYVSPTSPDWYRDAIETASRRAGLDLPVQRSGLLGEALF